MFCSSRSQKPPKYHILDVKQNTSSKKSRTKSSKKSGKKKSMHNITVICEGIKYKVKSYTKHFSDLSQWEELCNILSNKRMENYYIKDKKETIFGKITLWIDIKETSKLMIKQIQDNINKFNKTIQTYTHSPEHCKKIIKSRDAEILRLKRFLNPFYDKVDNEVIDEVIEEVEVSVKSGRDNILLISPSCLHNKDSSNKIMFIKSSLTKDYGSIDNLKDAIKQEYPNINFRKDESMRFWYSEEQCFIQLTDKTLKILDEQKKREIHL